MRAVKWVSGVFVVSAILALMCFASTRVMIEASQEQEGMFFLVILIAFIGLASSVTLLLIIVPRVLHERIQKSRSKRESN